MVNLSRRLFLGGTLAVTGAAILKIDPAEAIPTLYGDGVHDDTKALQALFDGNPVRIEGFIIADTQAGHIKGGQYLISETIHIRNRWDVQNCMFIGTGQNFGPVLHFHADYCSADGLVITNLTSALDHDTTPSFRELPAASKIVM